MDTITLKIKHPDFRISRPEYFSPRVKLNTNDQIDNAATYKDVYKKFVQNQSSNDKQDGIYKPSLAITQCMKSGYRELEWFLSIQISVPRLLYFHNIYEISAKDMPIVAEKILHILSTMGIETSLEKIYLAVIKKFHVGKNIILPSDYTVSQAINLLHKTITSRKTKKRQSHYENDGEALHFYTSTHGRIFYNKFKDYERTKVSTVDKNRTKVEQIACKKISKDIQILRFEIRYNGQQTVTSKLKPYLKLQEDVVRFESIFDENLWKNITQDEWKDIIESPSSQLALRFEIPPEDILKEVIKFVTTTKNSNVYSLNKINDLFGVYIAINMMGVQKYRNLLEINFSEKTLGTRLKSKLATVQEITAHMPIHPIIEYIDQEIRNYKPITAYTLPEPLLIF